MLDLVKKIAKEAGEEEHYTANVIKLLFDEDCTIPFVARYRKEMHGSMDELKIREVRDRYVYLTELEGTKERYLKVVEEHCKAKPELQAKYPQLKAKFMACESKQELEDLYLPFKPKRKTRASVAKEKGLEPLLTAILAERATLKDLQSLAASYVTTPEMIAERKLSRN
ncbi:MAG: Tex-like N-terminal domain-containing protein [Bdellovibrionota bacterium]